MNILFKCLLRDTYDTRKKLTLVGITLMVMVSVLGLLLVVPWGIEAYTVWQLERMTG